MPTDETHRSAAARPEHVAAPIGADEAAQALRNGPIGALVVAGIAVALLFIGWMAFYFLLFLPRGPPLAEPPSNPLQQPLFPGRSAGRI